jgi:Sel1 repeat
MYAKLKSIVAIVRTGRKAGVYRPPTPVGHAEIVEPRVLEELAGATFQELNRKGNSARHLRPASSEPIAMRKPLRGDRAVTELQRRTGLGQDEVALAILRLKSATEPGSFPKPSVESNRSLASTILRFGAIFGAVALVSAIIAGVLLRPSTRQATDKAVSVPVAAPPLSVVRNEDLPQAEAAAPPSVPNRDGKTDEPTSQAEVTPAATEPPSPPSQSSQPLQVASAPTEAAPVSEAQSPPVQGDSAARHLDAGEISTLFDRGRHLDAEEIATLVNRGTDYLKTGDVASARLLLRRAAEAGSASAALTLGTTFDPLVIQQLGAFGVVPDVAQARQWYEKAAELGSEAASQRLAKLAHTGQ